MSAENEAQKEGQILNAGAAATMTEAEIDAKIESDPQFAADFAAGKIIDFSSRQQPEAEPAPKKADTPAEANTEGLANQQIEEKSFTLKESDLVIKDAKGNPLKRFKTPAEVLKALSNQEQHIRQLNQQKADLNSRIAAANQKVEDGKAAGKPEAAGAEKVETLEMPEDPFDPKYLAKLGEAAKKVEALEKKVSAFEERDAKNEQRQKNTDFANQVFNELSEIQETVPGLKTKQSVQEIDTRFAYFLENIGRLAGTDGTMQANIRAMDLFKTGTGEQAENLRKAVEADGLVLPDEYDTYQKVLTVRNMHRKLQELDSEQTIDQTILYLQNKGMIELPKKEAPVDSPDAKAAQAAADKARQDGIIEAAAKKRQEEHATDVPAGVGSAAGGIDDMSAEQMDALLDTPVSELRKDPALKARVDALYKKLGMPPLNLAVE